MDQSSLTRTSRSVDVYAHVLWSLTYRQYKQLMEDFKEVHKELETFRNTGFSTAEIKKVREMADLVLSLRLTGHCAHGGREGTVD